jgi:hypothetical protein
MMHAPCYVAGNRTSQHQVLALLGSVLQDFANMPIDEVRININTRRDRIFLLMEELRRLRIQQRLKVMTHRTQHNQWRCPAV